MARREITGNWTRDDRIAINENFRKLFEEYVGAGLDAKEAREKAHDAVMKSDEALALSERTQKELSQAILEGDSSPLGGQLSVGADGTIYSDPQDRLVKEFNSVNQQLAQTEDYLARNMSQRSKGSRPIVSFILDDGRIEDMTKILPIAQEKNAPFGSAIVTSWVGTTGYMTETQLHEMEDTGLVEIMAHTHTHRNLRQLSKAEIEEDVSTNKRILEQMGFRPKGFVYPFNEQDVNTIDVVQRHYDVGYCRHPYKQVKNYPRIDNQEIDRVSMGSFFDPAEIGNGMDTSSLEYYKYRVDEAIKNNSWLIFVLHPASTDATQFGYYADTIDYIQSKGVEILKPHDAFNIHGNMIQTRDFAISKDGINVSKHRQILLGMNAFDGNALITDFPENAITEYWYNNAGSDGFPTPAGRVTVDRLSPENGYGHQKIKVYASNRGYERFARADGTWSPFVETVDFNHIRYFIESELNKYTADTPITAFRKNTTTIFEVNGASGFPQPNGTVTVHRALHYEGDSYREFQGYASRKRYYQNVNADGSWGIWDEIATISDVRVDLETVVNKYSFTSKPSDFPNNRTTIFYVNNTGSTGFPSDLPGQVEVKRIGDQAGYTRQEFRPYKQNTVWSRYAEDSNTWSPFVKISAI